MFPYLISRNDWPVSLVYDMYGDSVSYVNMNWEQLISRANEEYKKPQDDFVKKCVNHIAWNTHFKDYLVNSGVSEGSIKITGNPANQKMYRMLDQKQDWRKKLSIEHHLDKDKKWLFMPMNYGWAFSSDGLINAKIKKGYPEQIAWKYREYSKKCLVKFLFFVDAISEEYEIIVRPHPSITIDDYINVFEKELGYVPNNVTLNKAYSIREWIVASDLVGSSWSTSVWDAYSIGKPVFLFTPYERPEWLDVWWNDEVANLVSFTGVEFSSIKNIQSQDAECIEKIADFIIQSQKNKCVGFNRSYLTSFKSSLKIVRSLCMEKNLLPSSNLKYDLFTVVR